MESMKHQNESCPTLDSLPTMEEFQEGFGGWAIALYMTASVITLILWVQYMFLIRQFVTSVEPSRLTGSLWVTSIYALVSSFNLVGIFLPQASNFVWMAYKIYIAIAMGFFVELTLSWYGGETAMMDHVGEESVMNFRRRPCCCCFFCPKNATLTKGRLRFMKASVYQIPYTESVCLFFIISLQISGYLKNGNLAFTSPYTYFTAFQSISYMGGLWGLFMFFNITHQFNLLHNYNYRKKSTVMKMILVIVNFQGIIIDTIANYGGVTCIPGLVSSTGVGAVIKATCVMIESLLLGTASFIIYKDQGSYM